MKPTELIQGLIDKVNSDLDFINHRKDELQAQKQALAKVKLAIKNEVDTDEAMIP